MMRAKYLAHLALWKETLENTRAFQCATRVPVGTVAGESCQELGFRVQFRERTAVLRVLSALQKCRETCNKCKQIGLRVLSALRKGKINTEQEITT
jgi:hypothetical protein